MRGRQKSNASLSSSLLVTFLFGACLQNRPRSPMAFDIREHRPDFLVGQLAAERRHVAVIVLRRIRRDQPIFGDGEEPAVRMMPGVPALIVRRRRQASVGAARTPVRLAFELGPVAAGTVLRVDLRAERKPGGVARVCARVVAPRYAGFAASREQNAPPRGQLTTKTPS